MAETFADRCMKRADSVLRFQLIDDSRELGRRLNRACGHIRDMSDIYPEFKKDYERMLKELEAPLGEK